MSFWKNPANLIGMLLLVAIIGTGSYITLRDWNKPVPDANESVQIALPLQLSGKAGRLVKVASETNGSTVRWYVCQDKENSCDLVEQGKQAFFVSSKPGTYKVLAWTAAGDSPSKAAVCLVSISGDVPPPPPPPPPDPTDPLTNSLKAAYGTETSPAKKQQLTTLKLYYGQAAIAAQNKDLKTVGDLYRVLSAASKSLLTADLLPKVRDVINKEMQSKLPRTANTQLDGPTRDLCISTFEKIQKSLGLIDE